MANVAEPDLRRRLLTTDEVAGILGVSPDVILGLAHQGVLPSVRLTPRAPFRFRVEDVERLIAGKNPEASP